MVAVVVLALVLFFAAGTVVSVWWLRGGSRPAVMEDYFAAIARADSQTALALLASPPADTSLMTDEVLRRSNELGGVRVVEIEGRPSNLIKVALEIGGERDDAWYRVVRTDDGWRIDSAVTEVRLTELAGLDHTVNGVRPADGGTLQLLPGVYELGDPTYLSVQADPLRVPGGSSASLSAYWSVRLQPDDDGVEAARQAVAAAVEQCVADLDPDCGMDVDRLIFESDPTDVRLTLTSDPATDWTDVTAYGTRVSGPLDVQLRLRYRAVDHDGDRKSFDDELQGVLYPTVELTGGKAVVLALR